MNNILIIDKVDALVAEGHSLRKACDAVGASLGKKGHAIRTYYYRHRWKDVPPIKQSQPVRPFRIGHKHKSLNSGVYFMQTDNGFIKIGYSDDIRQRIQSITPLIPNKLEIMAVIPKPVGNVLLEKSLHKRFKHLHCHHEWFHMGADLLHFLHTEVMFVDNKSYNIV